MKTDERYVGIAWKDGGRKMDGADCAGLAGIFLQQEFGWTAPVPDSADHHVDLEKLLAGKTFDVSRLKRGDVIFFRYTRGPFAGKIRHVASYLGDNKLLATYKGLQSRIENGFSLSRRLGMEPVASLGLDDSAELARALSDRSLREAAVILFVIAILLSIASAFLMPRLARNGNRYGKYGFDGLVTQNSPEIPLPDILGQVTVAGNSPYTQLRDQAATVSDPTQQKVNKIVVLASGPVEGIDSDNFNIMVNGLSFTDASFFNGTDNDGIFLNPDQTKAAAVTGTIGADSNVPSMTVYAGTHDITVPVDIRAQYDRTFPIYGYPGCSYIAFRLINSQTFSSFNLNARVKGRLCRTYSSAGFDINTVSAEAVGTGDGATVRFKLANFDIVAVTSVTVGGTSYTQMDSSHQTGNVFHLNKTKGFIEFPTAPSAAAAIVADYTYYPRAWSQNPADHIVYLLTEKGRGKGYDGYRIDWDRAVSFQSFCNGSITWTNADGSTTQARYTTNYSIDFRKPINEHIQAILDSANAYLFISDGKFVLKARTSDSSVFSFDESNILRDSFSSELVDRSDRPNRLKLFFHDQNTYNSEQEVDIDNAVDQSSRSSTVGNDGVVEQTLKFPAIDNKAQTEIIGNMLLSESINSRWTSSFKTTILGIALEPGDIIDLTHSSQPSWIQKLFRVEDIQYGDDDRMQIQASEYFDGAYS